MGLVTDDSRPRIFVGYDQREAVAYHVLCQSLIDHSSEMPASVTPLTLRSLRFIHRLEKRPADQSNDFGRFRFLVPRLCDYEGWAIYVDCDTLFMEDPVNLWDHRDDAYAVQVVKHNHNPPPGIKYLGEIQRSYRRKNWSSVMLMNCAELTGYSPEYVEKAKKEELHGFNLLKDSLIGELPSRWNQLVGHSPPEAGGILHYTEGGPYFLDYVEEGAALPWLRVLKRAAMGLMGE